MSPESEPTPEQLYEESKARLLDEDEIVLGGVSAVIIGAKVTDSIKRGPPKSNKKDAINRGSGDNAWREVGACWDKDPSIFFPPTRSEERKPKRICRGCDVQEDCLDYALRNKEDFGVWGGTSESERRKIHHRS